MVGDLRFCIRITVSVAETSVHPPIHPDVLNPRRDDRRATRIRYAKQVAIESWIGQYHHDLFGASWVELNIINLDWSRSLFGNAEIVK